jgi:hypothetical protein
MDNTAAESSRKIRIEIERARNHHHAYQPPENAHSQAFKSPREVILRGIQNLGIFDRFSEWLKPSIAHDMVPIRLRPVPAPAMSCGTCGLAMEPCCEDIARYRQLSQCKAMAENFLLGSADGSRNGLEAIGFNPHVCFTRLTEIVSWSVSSKQRPREGHSLPFHSITSSARPSNESGTVMQRILY